MERRRKTLTASNQTWGSNPNLSFQITNRDMNRVQSEIYTTELPTATRPVRTHNSFNETTTRSSSSTTSSYEEVDPPMSKGSWERLNNRRIMVSDEPKYPKHANALQTFASEPSIHGSKPNVSTGIPRKKPSNTTNSSSQQHLGTSKAGQLDQRKTSAPPITAPRPKNSPKSSLSLPTGQANPISTLSHRGSTDNKPLPTPPPKPAKPIQPVYPIPVKNTANKKDLYDYPWFHGSIDRETASDRLKSIGIDGTFLVRRSASRESPLPTFSLSVLVEGVVYHSLIGCDQIGRCKFEDSTDGEVKTFPGIGDMINYYRDHSLLLIRSRPNSVVSHTSCVTKLGLFPDRCDN